MARKNNTKNSLRTHDGGQMTISTNGNGFRIDITRGYKETPQERKERLAAGNRSRVFTSSKQKSRGGRAGARRAAILQFS